jgi:serine/threonine protein kinase
VDNIHRYTKGCVHDRRDSLLYCKKTVHLRPAPGSQFDYGYEGHCCNSSDLCNSDTFPFNSHLTKQTASNTWSDVILRPAWLIETDFVFSTFNVIVLMLVAILIISLLIGLLWRRCSKRTNSSRGAGRSARKLPVQFPPRFHHSFSSISDGQPRLKVTATGDSTLREIYDQTITSGTGWGMPLLKERTIAKDITLMECIGKGRFGEVRRAIMFGEEVAVKIFTPKDRQSWKRETDILNMYTLNHDAILKYLGSDIISNDTAQMWLISDYHKLGSLYDFLETYTLNVSQALGLMTSAICGLFHLHDEFVSVDNKPGIAHRDLKSKNILMKSTSSVCLADFGLSLTSIQVAQRTHINGNVRQGTKRYMPPEVLDESIDVTSFEWYKRGDIYSFSLVLWEILNRCDFWAEPAKEFRLPYHQWVPSDPSFDQMVKVVCIDQLRPELPDVGIEEPTDEPIELVTSDDAAQPEVISAAVRQKQRRIKELHEQRYLLFYLCRTVKETWTTKPHSRLTALRIKKDLINLQSRWLKFRSSLH